MPAADTTLERASQPDLAAILERLDALVEEQRATRRVLETLAAQRAKARGPRDDDDRAVLLAVVDVVAGTRFSAREVFEHRSVAAPLADALTRADIGSAKSLGRLFQRCEDHDIGGFRLARVDRDGDNGIVWRVSRLS